MGLTRFLDDMNPVTYRELSGAVRYWLFQGIMVGIVSALVATTLLSWPTASMSSRSSISWRGGGGRIFDTFVAMAAGCLYVLIPLLSFDMIVKEREARTLESLIVSPLEPEDVIRGKVAAVTTITLYLIFAPLPVVASIHLLGGIAASEIARGVIMLAGWGILLATFSVWTSSVFLKRWQCFIASYLIMGASLVLYPVTIGFLLFSYAAGVTIVMGVLVRSINPYPTVLHPFLIVLGGGLQVLAIAIVIFSMTRSGPFVGWILVPALALVGATLVAGVQQVLIDSAASGLAQLSEQLPQQ